MSEEQLLQLFKEIKPTYKVNESWLEEQRAQLLGAIEVTGEHGLLQRLAEDIRIWWDELPYYWASARPALAMVSAVAVGVLVGRFVFTAPAPTGLLATGEEEAASELNLADLIRTGQVKGIDVGASGDPEAPVELNLTVGREMKLAGSTEREDILAALEYVLVKDPNPGQRLQSAKILGNTANLESKQSTVMALVSALLSDDNPGVRLSVIKSLTGVQSPLAKDALVKTVMEDENESVRRAAVENLAYFLNDLSVRSALLLVSRMDPIENVRFRAYQVLSQAPDNLSDESLDIQ